MELPYATIGSDETLTEYIGFQKENSVIIKPKRDSSNKTLKAQSLAVNATKYGAILMALALPCKQFPLFFEACSLIMGSTRDTLAVASPSVHLDGLCT